MDALCQIWLKSAQQFWRRFLNFIKVFWLFHNFLPLKKGRALHLHKIESSSPKDVLCQVWLKLAQRFWRRRWKCEKFKTRPTTTKTMDNRHIFIRKAHLSLRLRWANKKYKHSILVLDNSTVWHQFSLKNIAASRAYSSVNFWFVVSGCLQPYNMVWNSLRFYINRFVVYKV